MINIEVLILFAGYSAQLPQAYRPVQGRGHWRTPIVPHK